MAIITKRQRDELVAAAVNARQQAYAPYSNFPVGAAVLTADGRVFSGCNVENASFGLTLCAERVATAAAIAAGCRSFTALAVVTSNASPPCGACRQFLAEFCDDLCILLLDPDHTDRLDELQLGNLLPRRFEF